MTIEAGEEDWAAAHDAIRERMRELKMSTAALARESGLSETTVRYFGQSMSGHNRSSLVAISAVLRWRHDHLVNILNGEPEKNVHIGVPTATALERLVRDETAKLREQLDTLSATLDAMRWQLQRQQRLSRQQTALGCARNSRQPPARVAAGKRSTPRRKQRARVQPLHRPRPAPNR